MGKFSLDDNDYSLPEIFDQTWISFFDGKTQQFLKIQVTQVDVKELIQKEEPSNHTHLLKYLLHPYTRKKADINCVNVKNVIKLDSKEYDAALCSDSDPDEPTKVIFLDRPGNVFYRVCCVLRTDDEKDPTIGRDGTNKNFDISK